MRLSVGSLFCCALALAGCKKGDGIVLVSVTATSAAPVTAVTRLHVTATLDQQTKMFDVPTGGQPFDLPPAKTFGIDIPTALTGTLTLHVDAFGAASATAPIASGDGMAQVVTGKRVDLPVTLIPTGGGGGDGGTGGDGGAVDLSGVDFGPVVAPQLIAPLSTATVTKRRPTLHWRMGGGTPKVVLCQDRFCTLKLTTIDVTIGADSRSAVPNSDLPTGVVFWRVEAIDGSTDLASPTWEMFVGPALATVAADTSNTNFLDVNGDGYGDVAVGASSAGKVHIFLGGAGGVNSPGATSQDLASPDGTVVSFGFQVAAAGDVNGDGYGDIVVGSLGKVFVYLGSSNGTHPTVPSSVQEIDTPASAGTGSGFGQVVTGAGDVNGDGYADILVTAPTTTVAGTAGVGRAYVFLGSASGVQPAVASQVLSIDGIDPHDSEFGDGAAAADVNGDGYSDVMVAAEFGGPNMEGRLIIFLGGADGLQPNNVNRVINFLSSDGEQSLFGAFISATDLNGDGYSDVVIGAPDATVGAVANVGRVHVYLGSADGPTPALPASQIAIDGADGQNSGFGQVLNGAGDLDGDGYGDFIVGESGGVGKAFVYFGAATGGYRMPALTIASPDGNGVGYGSAVAGVGDTNGDGYNDVAVGASSANGSLGRVHVYLGGATGLQPTTAGRFVTIDSPDPANSGFGQQLALHVFKPKLRLRLRNPAAKS